MTVQRKHLKHGTLVGACDEIRRLWHTRDDDPAPIPDDLAPPLDPVAPRWSDDDSGLFALYQFALDTQPPRNSDMVRRRVELGETFSEVGAHFGVSPGRVQQVVAKFQRVVIGVATNSKLEDLLYADACRWTRAERPPHAYDVWKAEALAAARAAATDTEADEIAERLGAEVRFDLQRMIAGYTIDERIRILESRGFIWTGNGIALERPSRVHARTLTASSTGRSAESGHQREQPASSAMTGTPARDDGSR